VVGLGRSSDRALGGRRGAQGGAGVGGPCCGVATQEEALRLAYEGAWPGLGEGRRRRLEGGRRGSGGCQGLAAAAGRVGGN
jgi:hypothetical protein